MKKLIIAAATASALGLPAAAMGAGAIIFDRDGTGGMAGVHVDLWSWQTGQAICDNCTTTTAGGSGSGTLILQAALGGMSLSGNSVGPALDGISYQISIPVTTSLTGNTQLTITQAGAGTFTLFADPTPNFVYSTGCGFGSLDDGSCPANPDQIVILSGTASFALGSFTIIDTTALVGSPAPQPLASNTVGLIETNKLGGSTTINLDAAPGSADTNYFLSEITSLSIDLMVTAASFEAPMTVEASRQIMGVTADIESGNVGPDLQDLTCNRGLLDANVPCDQQYQVSANSQFNHNAPEPGSLALLGLGLGLAGLAGIRRRGTRKVAG